MYSGKIFIGSQSGRALIVRAYLVSILVVAVARATNFPTISIFAGDPGRLNLPNRPGLLEVKENGEN
jgi:hypothetical protein